MIDTYIKLLLDDKRVHKSVVRFAGGDILRVEDRFGSGILLYLTRFEVTNIPKQIAMVRYFGNKKRDRKTLENIEAFPIQNASYADQLKVLNTFMEQVAKGKKK